MEILDKMAGNGHSEQKTKDKTSLRKNTPISVIYKEGTLSFFSITFLGPSSGQSIGILEKRRATGILKKRESQTESKKKHSPFPLFIKGNAVVFVPKLFLTVLWPIERNP